ASCICAARCGAARPTKRCALGSDFPLASGATEEYPLPGNRQRPLQADSAKNRKRIGGTRLPDELAAALDLAVKAGCQGVCGLAVRGAYDEVVEAALGLVALGLEAFGQVARLLPGRAFDAHLPRGGAGVQLLRLP